jgi:iron uptake system component EfeO
VRRGMMVVAVCAAVLAPGAGSALAATSAHAAKTTTVTVSATEFKFKLSKASAPAGKVTFVVTNKGTVIHDFKIKGKKTAVISPGKKARLTVTFAKKGKFAYLCTIPGHAKLGMKGTFTIR